MAVGECGHEVKSPAGLGVHVDGARLRERLRCVVNFDDQCITSSVNPNRDLAGRCVQHGVGDQFSGDQLDSVQLFLAESYVPGANDGHNSVSRLLSAGCCVDDGECELVVRCHELAS